MQSKKILIFSTAYYPLVGGAEVAIKEITDRISDIQFDLITAKLDSKLKKEERLGNINVYRVGFGLKMIDKLLLPFFGAIKALSLNKKNHYSLYWCVMVSFGSGAAYVANILNFWKPIPIILTLQEGDSEEHFARRWFGLINLSWRMALKRTSRITALSNFLAERAGKFGYKGEINIIPNGVDINKFELSSTRPELKEEQRQKLGLKKDDIALITTSRLVAKNGIADVIRALPHLPENIKFIVVGEGGLKNKLEKLAADLRVAHRVFWLGFVSHEELPKYLKACDFFIRPSLSEGFGNSFIEAMSARLPVITTLVGGIKDFLIDGQTGYVCNPNDHLSIVVAVNRAMNDVGENRIIENAHRIVLERYTWDMVARQMENIFMAS